MNPSRNGEVKHYVLDWRKWGFGFSIEFRDPAHLRLWLGPLRVGLSYGHFDD